MIMSYCERKMAVQEDFEEFHIKMGYSLAASLFAVIGEAEYSPLCSQTDEICIYISFASLLAGQGEDISFLQPRLEELFEEKYMPQYERELGPDFIQFLKDWIRFISIERYKRDGAIYQIKKVDLQELKHNSPLDQWFSQVILKPVDGLFVGEIARMLRQGVYLDIAIPCAWNELLNDPFCGEMYDGELLVSLTGGLSDYPQERRNSLYRAFIGEVERQIAAHEWAYAGERADFEKYVADFSSLFACPR